MKLEELWQLAGRSAGDPSADPTREQAMARALLVLIPIARAASIQEQKKAELRAARSLSFRNGGESARFRAYRDLREANVATEEAVRNARAQGMQP